MRRTCQFAPKTGRRHTGRTHATGLLPGSTGTVATERHPVPVSFVAGTGCLPLFDTKERERQQLALGASCSFARALSFYDARRTR